MFSNIKNKVNAMVLPIPDYISPSAKIVKRNVENSKGTADIINSIKEWLAELPQHIAGWSVDLLIKVYEILMLILQTPLFIFNNSYIKNVSLTLSGVSILIVTILTIFNGFKQMLKFRHIKFKDIYEKYFIATIGAGIAPVAFETAFKIINKIVEAITKIGGIDMTPNSIKSNIDVNVIDWFHTGALFLFDILLIALIIPILLQNGRRFFDLMILSATTPLALTAWVFDEYRHLFKEWWSRIKKLSLTPIIYALYIVLLGLFIFGTQNVTDGGGLLIKFIIILGGLSRLANPPNFVKRNVDQGGNVVDMWKKSKKAVMEPISLFKGVKNKFKK